MSALARAVAALAEEQDRQLAAQHAPRRRATDTHESSAHDRRPLVTR